VFWRLMPPALVILLAAGWLERVYLQPQPVAEPPQIDTVVKTAMVTRTVEDAVTIEADPEPIPSDFVSEAESIGASLNSLSKVRDDTVFRSGDDEAWFSIWQTLRSSDMPAFRKAGVRNVSFAELFGQPRSFRGRLVRFSGTLHRLQKVEAPANQYDITGYWQAWIQPDDGPASPIVVYFLQLPPGLPHGMKINEPVEVIGYFFKRWAYEATDAIRTAPLVMALERSGNPSNRRPQGAPRLEAMRWLRWGSLWRSRFWASGMPMARPAFAPLPLRLIFLPHCPISNSSLLAKPCVSSLLQKKKSMRQLPTPTRPKDRPHEFPACVFCEAPACCLPCTFSDLAGVRMSRSRTRR